MSIRYDDLLSEGLAIAKSKDLPVIGSRHEILTLSPGKSPKESRYVVLDSLKVPIGQLNPIRGKISYLWHVFEKY